MLKTRIPLLGERWTVSKRPSARLELAPKTFLNAHHAAAVIAAKALERLSPLPMTLEGQGDA